MEYREFCEKYDISLNSRQEEAVRKTKGATLMISVPGSGKTTVIVARTGYMLLCEKIPASEILTVTFSVEAAKSMAERFVKKFGAEVEKPLFRTVHSMSLMIIKSYCKKYKKKPHAILTDQSPVIKSIIENQFNITCREELLRDVTAHINKAKNLMYSQEKIASIDTGRLCFPELLKAYEDYKKKNKLMDFDDIMIFALDIMKEYPDILQLYQSRFKYFNVDEAQDNSLIQNRIMQLLSSESGNIFMVGDEDQCIYGFRGAYPQSFFEFSEKYGEENIIKLETNYRSCDKILRHAESFISQNKNRYYKHLRGVKEREGELNIRTFESIRERNEYMARDCASYGSAAILSRNNSSLVSVINYLEENGIDYSIKAGKNDFFTAAPVMDIIDMLNIINAWEEKTPGRDVKEFLERQTEARLEELRGLRPVAAIRFIMDELQYGKYLLNRATEGISLQHFSTGLNILESVADGCTTQKEMAERLLRIGEICEQGREGEKLSLLTCHGSKGLEFEKVYLIDVTDGVFPNCTRMSPEEYEEEVRLFYVGVTRAMNEAEVLNVRRSYYGESLESVFVRELMEGPGEAAGAGEAERPEDNIDEIITDDISPVSDSPEETAEEISYNNNSEQMLLAGNVAEERSEIVRETAAEAEEQA